MPYTGSYKRVSVLLGVISATEQQHTQWSHEAAESLRVECEVAAPLVQKAILSYLPSFDTAVGSAQWPLYA